MKNLFSLLLLGSFIACAAQAQVAVTIYNNDLAVVRDVRPIEFEKGRQTVRFTQVAARIDPTSVHFKPMNESEPIRLLEQNYEFDLVNSDALMRRYLNQMVVASLKEGPTLTGTLLSNQGSVLILERSDGRVVTINPAQISSIEYPALPQGLITEPTLVWLVNSDTEGQKACEISYITHGMNWQAEYVAVVNKEDTRLDLGAWVSIENESGATFENAQLKLVAGDVHVVRDQPPSPRLMREFATQAMEERDTFQEKSFFEYHLYTLPRKTTLSDKQIKQISLFPETRTGVEKIYTYEGQRDAENVQVALEFENRKENGLGIALPKGRFRVYKRDDDGAQEFIGEDRIDHTPKDEKIRLRIGNAFDIVGERVVKERDQLSRTSVRQTIEITLRNHKETSVKVVVVERHWGDWELVGETPTILDKDANKVEFLEQVPADGETVLRYTVISR
jgi:hypothetical protein